MADVPEPMIAWSSRVFFEIARKGVRWKDLPDRYPHSIPCWQQLRKWEKQGVLKEMWCAFLSKLDHEGILDWDEVFVDACFPPAKKGEWESGRPSRKGIEVLGTGR